MIKFEIDKERKANPESKVITMIKPRHDDG